MHNGPDEYEVFDPPCIVVIGDTRKLVSLEQKRTFELFRRQLKGVQVVTFDEVFGRAEQLIKLITGQTETPTREP